MYLPYAACGLRMRVSPFGHPRIAGYVRLPAAFRSLSRPSSASSAWAFALRPFSLDLTLLFSLPSAVFTASDSFSSKFYLSMSLLFLSFACFAVYAVFKVRLIHIGIQKIPNGDEGIRTLDPLLAREVLSQLSYTPGFLTRCGLYEIE